jgi:hypothetical protein
MNNLEINAALWSLLRQENIPESAELLIKSISRFPKCGQLVLELGQKKKPDSSFTGQTNAGNMTFKEDKGKQIETKAFGERYARIGHFKVWLMGSTIQFRHFWGSDVEKLADTDKSPEYQIDFDSKTFAFKSFGVLEVAWRKRIPLINKTLTRMRVRKIYTAGRGLAEPPKNENAHDCQP